MSWGRIVAALFLIWLAILAFFLQPHDHAPPRIEHARLLDATTGPLPTLAPFQP